MSLETGQVIEGKYRIVRLLGEGGMGAVYEGENTRIHRTVAIKVLHAGVAAKEDVVQRFEREAQAAGRIGSEHIVEVLDLGNLPGGERFMVMEYLEGEELGLRIKTRGRLSPEELAPIMVQLLEGLQAAHDAGIIHRDLKPDNVFLLKSKGGQKDFVKILDFGVSKFSALDNEMSMTRTGAVMGTPYYMSPEQARGQKVDNRSDLYSIGVVMYQAVTGQVPFNAETFNELVFKIALENAPPAEVLVPDLDRDFASIITKSMIRESTGRFQSASEFKNAILQWMAAKMPHAMAGMSGGFAAMSAAAAQQALHPQGQMNPALGQSGNALGQSGNGLDQSGNALGQSGNGLGQSGAMGQSGGFGASNAALAVTNKEPKRGGAMVVFGLIAAVVGVAGGFGVYYLRAAPAAAETPVAAEQPVADTEEETPEDTDPPETDTETETETAEETATETDETPEGAGGAGGDSEEAETTEETTTPKPVAVAPKAPPPKAPPPTAPPPKTPATPPPPPSTTPGRTIDGEL